MTFSTVSVTLGVLETEQVFSSGDEEVTVATATLKSDKHWQK